MSKKSTEKWAILVDIYNGTAQTVDGSDIQGLILQLDDNTRVHVPEAFIHKLRSEVFKTDLRRSVVDITGKKISEVHERTAVVDGNGDVARFVYSRTANFLRVIVEGMSNHEIREVMVGLFHRLDDDDKIDHQKELQHYRTDPRAFLSTVAGVIAGKVLPRSDERKH